MKKEKLSLYLKEMRTYKNQYHKRDSLKSIKNYTKYVYQKKG